MTTGTTRNEPIRERATRIGALAFLLLLGGLALAGPYGVLAWGENIAALKQREARVAELEAIRAELDNRVSRLDPDNADPDLAAELIRRDLNVIHPDEYVIDLREHQ